MAEPANADFWKDYGGIVISATAAVISLTGAVVTWLLTVRGWRNPYKQKLHEKQLETCLRLVEAMTMICAYWAAISKMNREQIEEHRSEGWKLLTDLHCAVNAGMILLSEEVLKIYNTFSTALMNSMSQCNKYAAGEVETMQLPIVELYFALNATGKLIRESLHINKLSDEITRSVSSQPWSFFRELRLDPPK